MRVLLANQDRDLLSGFRRLMELDGHFVDTAFDGTQVLELLDTGAYDLMILNECLPRAAHGRLMERAGQTPVIVLLDRPVDIYRLCQQKTAVAYLSFPFSPGDLIKLADSVLEKHRSGGERSCMGIRVDVSGFRFSGTEVRLTAGEMDLLDRLLDGPVLLPFRQRVYVHALNIKLEKAGYSQARIVYEEGNGYRLINGNGGECL